MLWVLKRTASTNFDGNKVAFKRSYDKQDNFILISLNSPKAHSINLKWNDHLCKILYSWPSRAWKKICWHFWVHFGIHAQSVSWCVLRRIGVDAKSGNALKVQELGQRSTECKFLYIRQILAFLSISYPKLGFKVMQNLFWIIQPCYINKQHHQGMMCVWIKGHLSAKSVKIVAILYLYMGKIQILSSLLS